MIEVCDRDIQEVAPELENLGLPLHLETGNLFAMAAPGAVFVFNFAMDASGGERLRHKTRDWTFALEPNGLGWETLYLSSESELTELLESDLARVQPAQIPMIRRVSKHLRCEYELVPHPDESEMAECMHAIVARIPARSKLIIVADHDQRRGSDSGQLITLSRVTRYRRLMQDLAAGYPHVAVVSVSDAIESPEEVQEANHYNREVYFRLSRNILDAANALEER